jgi:hypothetical protein
MTEEFRNVAEIYLSRTAKPLDVEEHTYRNCKVWTFRRVVQRWRPTAAGLSWYRENNKLHDKSYNDIPSEFREFYIHEFWTAISDYFIKYSCEFEDHPHNEIGVSYDREEITYRIHNYIDNHYAEKVLSTEDIP